MSVDPSRNSVPLSWQRLLALSGVVFAVLFVIGWFASGGDAPDYGASDRAWTNWADDNQWKSRIGAFAMLLAGFVFLHYAGMIRSVLGSAERTVGGSAQLARVAFAGAITGMAGMAMAIVMISGATTEGSDANPIVTRAVATASAGPFLLSAMGFAAFLMAGGLVTLRCGVFARWTGVVALIGAVSFLVTFVAVFSGLGEDSLFGFGFFPGVLALVIWSAATSIARYREVATWGAGSPVLLLRRVTTDERPFGAVFVVLVDVIRPGSRPRRPSTSRGGGTATYSVRRLKAKPSPGVTTRPDRCELLADYS